MNIKRNGARAVALLLIVTLLTGAALASGGAEADSAILGGVGAIRVLAGVGESEALLGKRERFPAGSSICDWAAMAFALSGVRDDYGDYLKALEDYVTAQYAAIGGLDANKATEWHRIALTALALGGDPKSFGRDPEGKKIDLIADGTYNYGGELDAQGTNGLIFALITLDSAGYETPEGSRYDRETILSRLLSRQNDDGSFGLSSGSSDVDITAMALTALAAYRADGAAPAAAERALDWLSACQAESGGFVSYNLENSESAAQVVIALCANGISPETDGRFIKNGAGVLDALMAFRLPDGSFMHTAADGVGDVMATEQAMLALLALRRLQNGGGSLYDLGGAAAPGSAAQAKGTVTIVIIAALCVAVIIAAVVILRKRARGKRNG